jgi:hypothetical protein
LLGGAQRTGQVELYAHQELRSAILSLEAVHYGCIVLRSCSAQSNLCLNSTLTAEALLDSSRPPRSIREDEATDVFQQALVEQPESC